MDVFLFNNAELTTREFHTLFIYKQIIFLRNLIPELLFQLANFVKALDGINCFSFSVSSDCVIEI